MGFGDGRPGGNLRALMVNIHPTAVIGDPPEHRDHRHDEHHLYPEIAASALVEAFVTVDAGIKQPTRIGAHSWLMKHVHVGHDAQVGAHCELAPGTVIAGHAVLEDSVRCGIGVLVRPFIRVGAGARLGAGAVVVKDVPAGQVWAGNPARELRPKRVPTGEFLTESEVQGWEEFADRIGPYLTPITRQADTHGNGVSYIALDPREACYVIAKGAKIDGKPVKVTLDGMDGHVESDGRVTVKILAAA